MVRLLIHWAISVLALIASGYVTNLVLPGQFAFEKGSSGLLMIAIAVAVLALINATLGKIIKFVTLPLNCLTLGLFSLVVNALMFYIVGNMGLGFTVHNFLGALLGSLLYSALNGIVGGVLEKGKDKRED